jgi:hypothetical protein
VEQALRSAADENILRRETNLWIRRIGKRNSLDRALEAALDFIAKALRDRVERRRS